MITALAGRRIDAPEAKEKRFPLQMKDIVYKNLLELFHKEKTTILIASAACGADLLAQKAARELGIERLVVLPFGRDKFRQTSVIDRPGDWGGLFDEICDEAEDEGNLIVLENIEDEEKGYAAATEKILELAEDLSLRNGEVTAVIVWDGKAKSEADETARFAAEARRRSIHVEEILTV